MAAKPTEEEIVRFADMFSAMGTGPRLRIMRTLLSAHPDGMAAMPGSHTVIKYKAKCPVEGYFLNRSGNVYPQRVFAPWNAAEIIDKAKSSYGQARRFDIVYDMILYVM